MAGSKVAEAGVDRRAKITGVYAERTPWFTKINHSNKSALQYFEYYGWVSSGSSQAVSSKSFPSAVWCCIKAPKTTPFTERNRGLRNQHRISGTAVCPNQEAMGWKLRTLGFDPCCIQFAFPCSWTGVTGRQPLKRPPQQFLARKNPYWKALKGAFLHWRWASLWARSGSKTPGNYNQQTIAHERWAYEIFQPAIGQQKASFPLFLTIGKRVKGTRPQEWLCLGCRAWHFISCKDSVSPPVARPAGPDPVAQWRGFARATTSDVPNSCTKCGMSKIRR